MPLTGSPQIFGRSFCDSKSTARVAGLDAGELGGLRLLDSYRNTE